MPRTILSSSPDANSQVPRSLAAAFLSTRWPGVSRFAVHILLFTTLLSLAQVCITLTYGVVLLQVGSEVLCTASNETRTQQDEYVRLPATFASQEENGQMEYLSLRRGWGPLALALGTMLLPLLTFLTLFIHSTLHFRTLSNWTGLLCGTTSLGLFGMLTVQAFVIDIDAPAVHNEYNWCWTSGARMRQLRGMRRERGRMAMGTLACGVLGLMCMSLYIFLALLATRKNHLNATVTNIRLDSLRRSTTNVDQESHAYTASAPTPPLPARTAGAIAVPLIRIMRPSSELVRVPVQGGLQLGSTEGRVGETESEGKERKDSKN